MNDWKAVLAAMRPADAPDSIDDVQSADNEGEEIVKGQVLCISFQRRAGNPATILSGWLGSDEALKRLVAELKSALASGGSVRDDEILLQGDVRDKVRKLLQQKGYKTKGG